MAKARKRFEYTATGVLGDKRETMLDNELLLRVKSCRLLFPCCSRPTFYLYIQKWGILHHR